MRPSGGGAERANLWGAEEIEEFRYDRRKAFQIGRVVMAAYS
jgi:hypothetical protein